MSRSKDDNRQYMRAYRQWVKDGRPAEGPIRGGPTLYDRVVALEKDVERLLKRLGMDQP